MPATRKPRRPRLRRLTIIFEPGVYAELERLAKSLGLQLAPCARMLVIEALATRTTGPPATPTAPRQPQR